MQSLPPALEHLVSERYAELAAACRAAGVAMHDDAGVAERIRRTLAASDFAFDALRAAPELLTADGLERLGDPQPASARAAVLGTAGAHDDALAGLRRFRRAEAVRLVFRDVNGIDEVTDTLVGATELYQMLIATALQHAEAAARRRHGTPHGESGAPQSLVVFALGKLGGGELNFSSDVDLVLAYPEAGATDGARPLDNAEFFTRVAHELVRLLTEPTADGSAARVDLRLRPFGESGPVVASFAAMEQYFQRAGRDWERYAWIKARAVAGDVAAGRRLLAALRPFVYRRYFDYTALAGLRDMKTLIDAEVARRDLADDLKLGPGGIREVEFVVQLQQLIRGGRDASLRVQGLLPALAANAARGYLPQRQARALRAAYLFLRRLENRVQMFADRQTQALPADPVARARLAWTLDYPDWAALLAALAAQRRAVGAVFADVLQPADDGGRQEAADSPGAALWQAVRGGSASAAGLLAAGFEPGAECLAGLRQVAGLHGLSARGADRIQRLMPALIDAAAATVAPGAALVSLCRLVQAVARRSAYLALLQELPTARERVARLCAESAFLAERVIAQPLLLDDVLAPRVEHLAHGTANLRAELARQLASQAARDPEAALVALAEWQGSYRMRSGLAFRDGTHDAVATARGLAELAAAVVGAVLDLAIGELAARHGLLPGSGSGIAVLGYGSLGGAELGFNSDLDLVFVYDAARAEATSDGARPLDGVRWYARLAQRVVHWLSASSRGGRLYDVDTRLRPDGGKSMLVASLPAFVAYQRERAWTWEQQALVRARPVAGDAALADGFAAARRGVLQRPRERRQVIADVCRMRAEWRAQRDRSDAGALDLKQGAGALLDIQFLLQGLVLLHAREMPALVASGDTPSLLAACAAAGLLAHDAADALAAAHAELLQRALSATLAGTHRVVPRDLVLDARCHAVLAVARAAGFDFAA
ncbi:MAG TPA: bifunctional [glutamate--ammonia ligase]-adenylyl-L-tyrosine phosphorylase/[glutamate--ammonia-ligase] adenylyltransferase [Rhodanobacteraceae bacterium]